jgi:Protein of unknown function (DUF3237)
MKLEPVMTLSVEVAEIIATGPTPVGEVRLLPFAGGTFEGKDMRGRLLPGGTDWQQVRADGVIEIRAHYLLETDRGERIEVNSQGIRHAPPGVLERIAAGEPVPSDQYYFRTHVRLNTGSERLAHLNRMLLVSSGERQQHTVLLTFYAIP